ncbi:hypothetical protein Syun_023925 [Stephania yunnanensis]|uniref:Uncharacterized protein n=1 Tax=Stephania yunnanensis TaxID=152371 RepID=A0AAP0FAS7_9MAGN
MMWRKSIATWRHMAILVIKSRFNEPTDSSNKNPIKNQSSLSLLFLSFSCSLWLLSAFK